MIKLVISLIEKNKGGVIMSKRTVATIKQYDYTSKEEFEKDIEVMKSKGYFLLNSKEFKHGELKEDNWKYTGYFIKDTL